MIDFCYLETLIEKLLDKKGRLNALKIKYNPDIVEELNNIEFLKEFPTLVEKYCAIRERFTERRRCLCGELTNYNIGNSTYSKFCGNKCNAQLSIRSQQIRQGVFTKYGVENVSQIKEINEKRINNNLEKYGVRSTSQLQEVKEKIKKTNLERYGVEYTQQSKTVRAKSVQTNLEKYGTECVLSAEDIREKAKVTNLKRYGNEIAQQSEIVKEKTKLTNLARYGGVAPAISMDVKNKIKQTNLERYGTEKPQQLGEIKDKIRNSVREQFIVANLPQRLENIEFVNNVVPFDWKLEEYSNSKDYYQFQHVECGRVFESSLINGRIPNCPRCNNIYSSSRIERKIREDLVDILGSDRVKYNDRNLIKPYELDIIVDDKLAIEVNGVYWHSEKNETLPLLEKNQLSPIPILHFWDLELTNKYEICKSIILSKLGIFERRMYARECVIKEVNTKDSAMFLEANHLQGKANASINYGLYHNDELVTIITIGKSRFNKKYAYEILRIASKLNTQVIGGISKLFKFISQILKENSIITYADKRYSNGDIYRKLGFKELTDSKSNYFWVKNNEVLTRYQAQKHKLPKFLKFFDKSLTESENMQLNNYYKIHDCGNKVFVIDKM